MTFMSATERNPESPEPPAGARGTSGALRMTPGRWVALAIAMPVALALIGWTGFSLVASLAQGSYPVNYPIPVHDGQVAVNVDAGNVTLSQSPGSTARLTGTVQYSLIRPGISESSTPAGADLSVNCDDIATDCGMNATLAVPARTAVTLSSNGGDIGVSGFSSSLTLSAAGGNLTASDLAGDMRLDTGGGDLTGNGLTGTIQIATEGGNVSTSALDGPTRIDTGGGDLTGNGLAGDLQFFTEGGNVNANSVDSRVVTIQSGGGDVTVQFTQPPQNLKITAQGGNVTVILPRGGTRYAISTPDTQGGNVNYPSALASPASRHTIAVDSGGGDITISEG
jgi:Putative adhesin